MRRVVREVYGERLEAVCGVKATRGSNPLLSAIEYPKAGLRPAFLLTGRRFAVSFYHFFV